MSVDDLGYVGGEDKAELLHFVILFAEDREIVIELVVFFYQVVRVVGDEGGTVFLSCFADDRSIVGYHLDQVFFLFGDRSRCRQLFR